jgi:alkylhydroperoxidase/carboxymuconolactone decarboxylase family protein YurZ
MEESPEYSKAYGEFVQKLESTFALDPKTTQLAYIAVLSAVNLNSGLPYHVNLAKQQGATRDEVMNAVLIGLSAVGNIVIKSLPIALNAYDNN